MKVIFIHHSCFVVVVDEKVLIFDWFAGDRVDGYTFHGQIPQYEPDTPVYVFASHKHRDHFDMDVLKWSDYYKNIHYIFSKDCKMTERFLVRHGFSPEIMQKILYVSPCEKYQVDNIEIETLRSTDAGVAFYLKTNGASFYHAGDLNDWKLDGVGELVNSKMEFEYKNQIRKLAKKEINLAFVPMDPRQGEYQFLGIDYFMRHTDAEYVFPMHMWQDYSGIDTYLKKVSNRAMAERIVRISHENQEFDILEE